MGINFGELNSGEFSAPYMKLAVTLLYLEFVCLSFIDIDAWQ